MEFHISIVSLRMNQYCCLKIVDCHLNVHHSYNCQKQNVIYYGNVSNVCSRGFEVILLTDLLFLYIVPCYSTPVVATTARFTKVLTKSILRVFLGLTPIPKCPIVGFSMYTYINSFFS